MEIWIHGFIGITDIKTYDQNLFLLEPYLKRVVLGTLFLWLYPLHCLQALFPGD